MKMFKNIYHIRNIILLSHNSNDFYKHCVYLCITLKIKEKKTNAKHAKRDLIPYVNSEVPISLHICIVISAFSFLLYNLNEVLIFEDQKQRP